MPVDDSASSTPRAQFSRLDPKPGASAFRLTSYGDDVGLEADAPAASRASALVGSFDDGRSPGRFSSTFARSPALAVILVFGLIVAFGALALRLQGMAFGGPPHRSTASTAPIAAPLGWVLLAGIFPPPPLAAWFQHVAAMLR